MTDPRPDCDHCRERLTEMIYGELDRDTRREVQEHLDACDDCRAEFEKLSHVRSLMRQARTLPTPPGLEARVMSEARSALGDAEPAREARPDPEKTSWLARLFAPGLVRPAVAAALTVLLVAGIYFLVRDRKQTVLERYEKPTTTRTVTDQAVPAAPPKEHVAATKQPPEVFDEEKPVDEVQAGEEIPVDGLAPGKKSLETKKEGQAGASTSDLFVAESSPLPSTDLTTGSLEDEKQQAAAKPPADKSDFATLPASGSKKAGGQADPGQAGLTESTTQPADTAIGGAVKYAAGDDLAAMGPPTPTGVPGGSTPSPGSASTTAAPASEPVMPKPTAPTTTSKAPAPPMEAEESLAEPSADLDAEEAPPAKKGKDELSWWEKYKLKKTEKKAKKKGQKEAKKKEKGKKGTGKSAPSTAEQAPAPTAALEKPVDPFEQAMDAKKKKNYTEAISILKKLKNSPSETQESPAKVYHQLAWCTAASGDEAKALVYYENLLARWPGYPGRHRAMWQAALLYIKAGDKAPARKLLEKLADVPAYSNKAKKKLESLK